MFSIFCCWECSLAFDVGGILEKGKANKFLPQLKTILPIHRNKCAYLALENIKSYSGENIQ